MSKALLSGCLIFVNYEGLNVQFYSIYLLMHKVYNFYILKNVKIHTWIALSQNKFFTNAIFNILDRLHIY